MVGPSALSSRAVPIDLNADLGEGFGVWRLGDDEALLDVVSSANVACGFHGGDPTTMVRVCGLAVTRGVAIGAQVGYPDLVGFGRRRLDVAPDDLRADVLYQVGALNACARAGGGAVRYLKPHGALYNTAADDPGQATAVIDAAGTLGLPVLGPPASALADAAARTGVPFVVEAFADRAYTRTRRLVPRSDPAALITDEASVVERSVRLARDSTVVAVDGTVVDVEAQSLCVHGDTPGAAALARQIRRALADAGVSVEPFA